MEEATAFKAAFAAGWHDDITVQEESPILWTVWEDDQLVGYLDCSTAEVAHRSTGGDLWNDTGVLA